MKATLETSRLILRPFESGDVEAAFRWFGDPIVMRFTPTGPDSSIDQTKARLATYQEHQATHGFSKWIILERRLGGAIGDSGLLKLEEHGWIDLGFRLAQRYWGKGLATEAASAWVRAAFNDFHIDRLTALVHPENVASIRVLEKLRFHADRRDTVMGMNSILFSLDAKDVRGLEQRSTGPMSYYCEYYSQFAVAFLIIGNADPLFKRGHYAHSETYPLDRLSLGRLISVLACGSSRSNSLFEI